MDLNAPGGSHCAAETAENDNLPGFDFRFDIGSFAQHERAAGDDPALERTVEAERAGNLDGALDAGGGVEEAGPVGFFVILREKLIS